MNTLTRKILGIVPHHNPRHVEAFLRGEHGTEALESLKWDDFAREVRIAAMCCDNTGADQCEKLAQAYGLGDPAKAPSGPAISIDNDWAPRTARGYSADELYPRGFAKVTAGEWRGISMAAAGVYSAIRQASEGEGGETEVAAAYQDWLRSEGLPQMSADELESELIGLRTLTPDRAKMLKAVQVYWESAGPIPTPEKLADGFRASLWRYFQQTKGDGAEAILRVIDARNLRYGDGVCATHDFCDANIFMLEALQRLAPKLPPHGDRAIALWGKAWDVAKAKGFARTVIPRVGDRVRLTECVDNFPTGIFDANTTGTLTRVDEEGAYWVRLDRHYPELNEWQNELQIWDYTSAGMGIPSAGIPGEGPEEHPVNKLERIGRAKLAEEGAAVALIRALLAHVTEYTPETGTQQKEGDALIARCNAFLSALG